MQKQDIFYNGTKLLSLSDIDGKKPELYLCTTNRSGGKTTYFSRLVVNRFLKRKEKFGLLYRYNYELDDVSDKFFADIKRLFFPSMEMTSKSRAKGIYHELFLNGEPCGYAISINSADMIKKNSHLFSDIECMIFDEFQSESKHYCSKEVQKFISIHTSIARGNGQAVRHVPVFMLTNQVSILNPYYVELGISQRLRDDTNFLRGSGFVAEFGFIQEVSDQQKQSAFNRAFSSNAYTKYSTENVYLSDSRSFIGKPHGRSLYLCTMKYENKNYAVREYCESGYLYCDDKPDLTHPLKIVVTTVDHSINYVMLKRNSIFLGGLRSLFERGCFRFKDQQCKEVILKALAYI